MIRKLIKEALDRHRELRWDIMNLMERAAQPNMTKAKMIEELFKIYLKFK